LDVKPSIFDFSKDSTLAVAEELEFKGVIALSDDADFEVADVEDILVTLDLILVVVF
jgi:hypothetical protein